MAEQMKVRVSLAQFEAIHAINLRLGCRYLPTASAGLKAMLSQCAEVNGGSYDPTRHEAGECVELIVIV